jgi:hypothetical protein
MTPSYLLNQSMPSMMSIPLESRRIRFDGKSTPLIVILTVGHICFVLISPPGELTSGEQPPEEKLDGVDVADLRARN